MTDAVTLRPSQPDDNPFLFQVYSEVRRDEVARLGWSPQQQEAFFRLQFTAQQQGYRLQFPGAEYSIVQLGALSVGSLIVARRAEEIRLVDIALLPAFRGKGIGGKLIAGLLSPGAGPGRPVRLTVMKGNRAINLYKRLGFSEIGEGAGGMYITMESFPRARRDAPGLA